MMCGLGLDVGHSIPKHSRDHFKALYPLRKSVGGGFKGTSDVIGVF